MRRLWEYGLFRFEERDIKLERFLAKNHCLNKLERLVHSEVTRKIQVQMTLFPNCLVLKCSRHFVVYKNDYRRWPNWLISKWGFFWKILAYWSQKYLTTLQDRQLTTQNQNKFQKDKRKWQKKLIMSAMSKNL